MKVLLSKLILEAKMSTSDGRLTSGKLYLGDIVELAHDKPSRPPCGRVRVRVKDNRGELMTFNPKAFDN